MTHITAPSLTGSFTVAPDTLAQHDDARKIGPGDTMEGPLPRRTPEGDMSDDPRIGSPGTFEFSAPDGVLRAEWLGDDAEADARARERAEVIESECGGEYLVTQIRRRTEAGWETIRRRADG
ncbi:hypothetical protein [Streptacidiphilus sp. EB129]|uniref:hypothetical protein n=1 Tax=Streptacidiphilus sp. EB129 TaxID=3156262 RepID=UPI003513FEA7